MNRDPTTALVSVGPIALRRRLYAALARALSVARAPAVIAFAQQSGDDRVAILARPSSPVEVAVSEPALAGAWTPAGPGAPATNPPPAWIRRFGGAATYRSGPCDAGFGQPLDPPRWASLIGPDARLFLQTFWSRPKEGPTWVTRRWCLAAPERTAVDARWASVSGAVAAGWSAAVGVPVEPFERRWGARRDWERLGTRTIPDHAWVRADPARLDRTPGEPSPAGHDEGPSRAGPTMVLGATGAGKTWFLAHRVALALSRGEAVVAIDLHGDLGPAIAGRLDREARARMVAIDVTNRPCPGIAVLDPAAPADRAAGHLVAALKRLTPDGTDLYWGFRLERVLEAFVRLVHGFGGSIADVYSLLTDPDARDSARLATTDPDLVRFLEELGPIVRRNPEFLWGATARLAKIAAVPALVGLLAPDDGGLPVEQLLHDRRSVLIRLPFAELGPEAAAFAATLLLARIYLGRASQSRDVLPDAPVTVVLDEVQAFSPRLVAELFAEGRKFGLRPIAATQFPERLSPELRDAVAGTVDDTVVFRIPRPSVAVAAAWLGLGPADGDRWLTDLPAGSALARDGSGTGVRPVAPVPPPAHDGHAAWAEAVRATRSEFGHGDPVPSPVLTDGPVEERILLAILAAEERRRPLAPSELISATSDLPGPRIDAEEAARRIEPLVRRGLFAIDTDGVRLTAAGARRLGVGMPSGATRESAEHRRLVLAAFRLFARRGYHLEMVRQGRFDTRLPDALLRQLPERVRAASPAELLDALDRSRRGWAWRCFGGRDVHVEAEVSGALRPARIRHGFAKAAARGAFALFLVSDTQRARRVRATLRALGIDARRAQVWTLPPESPWETRGVGCPTVAGDRPGTVARAAP